MGLDWALNRAAVMAIAAVAVGTIPQAGSAAPIYDMRGMLGETHPFLLEVPPEPVRRQPAPTVPVDRPAAPAAQSQQSQPPASQPESGSGPMRLPRSFKRSATGAKGSADIQWKQPSGEAESMSDRGAKKKSSDYYEIRIGALAHDQGPFSSNKEDGYDANLELLFASPDFLDIIWSPRPHLGVTYNLYGDTSQAYFGLSWEWDFWQDFFAGFSLGGALHNGKLELNGFKAPLRSTHKELGCRVLFRESITLGYRLTEHHSIMGFFDHISNASLCDKNEGLETVGIRYGYRF